MRLWETTITGFQSFPKKLQPTVLFQPTFNPCQCSLDLPFNQASHRILKVRWQLFAYNAPQNCMHFAIRSVVSNGISLITRLTGVKLTGWIKGTVAWDLLVLIIFLMKIHGNYSLTSKFFSDLVVIFTNFVLLWTIEQVLRFKTRKVKTFWHLKQGKY